jgi:Methylamine utilisation protein MauE
MNIDLRILAQLIVGQVFLVSALGKSVAPVRFAHAVENYEIVPARIAFLAGLAIVPVELVIAFAHLTGFGIAAAAPAGLFLLCCFTVVTSVTLAKGRALPCYCFGGHSADIISWISMARLGLLILAEAIAMSRPGFFQTPFRSHYSFSSAQEFVLLLSWTAVVLLISIWALHAGDLIFLASRLLRSLRANSRTVMASEEQ